MGGRLNDPGQRRRHRQRERQGEDDHGGGTDVEGAAASTTVIASTLQPSFSAGLLRWSVNDEALSQAMTRTLAEVAVVASSATVSVVVLVAVRG